MSEVKTANRFFLLSLAFILGIQSAYFFKFLIFINLSLFIFFYLVVRNLKIKILCLLFVILGNFYYFLYPYFNFEKIKTLSFIETIETYRFFLEEQIKKTLPYPQENLLRGIFFGSKFEDKEIKNYFINSGLIHITAVSGQNLTLMFSVFYEFLKSLSFLSTRFLFYFSNFIIIFFVFIMGFEGNVLRAAIMAFFLILVKNKFGRIPLKRNILVITLFIFALFSPSLILNDIGTQLSFLAIFGIFYLSPIIENKLYFVKNNFFKKTISEILGAQIFTLPLILYKFGNFNFFSFVSNLFVLPVLPYIMSLAGIFLIFPLGYFGWIILPLLNYILKIAKIFSFFSIYLKIPLGIMIAFYVYLFLQIYYSLKDETIDFNFNFN